MEALLLVDLRHDFRPGGAMAVCQGHQVIAVANRLMPHDATVRLSQDWHPPNHRSFAVNHPGTQVGQGISVDGLRQEMWPVHCVRGSVGAGFHPALDRRRVGACCHKGSDPDLDSDSACFDNAHQRGTGLKPWLRQRQITRLVRMGLATDFGVRFTGEDARQLGFDVVVVGDGCREVALQPGDGARALTFVQGLGCRITTSDALTR